MPLVWAKLKVVECLRLLKKRAEESWQKAKELYEQYSNRKVGNLPKFNTGEWVDIDTPRILKIERTDTDTQDLTRKLISKKNGLFRALQVRNNTVTVDVIGIHNVVFIGRTTLDKTAKKAMSAAKKECHVDLQTM